jgi:hypothetical protein
MDPEGNSLERAYQSPEYDSSLESSAAVSSSSPVTSMRQMTPLKFNKLAFTVTAVAAAIVVLVGIGSLLLAGKQSPKQSQNQGPSGQKSSPATSCKSVKPIIWRSTASCVSATPWFWHRVAGLRARLQDRFTSINPPRHRTTTTVAPSSGSLRQLSRSMSPRSVVPPVSSLSVPACRSVVTSWQFHLRSYRPSQQVG